MVAPNPITIRKERFYPHPPEDVWAAITDPHALAEWLEPNDHQRGLRRLCKRVGNRVYSVDAGQACRFDGWRVRWNEITNRFDSESRAGVCNEVIATVEI